jgi:hypothetical protein
MGYKYIKQIIETILKVFVDAAGGLIVVISFTSGPSLLELLKFAYIDI